ncbi:MAG: cellulase family glycosylhydrolase, partial [Ruminococcus sp.]|nr:cellulase family glycosylhydrolase [Candidatus Copronaster equi]
IMENSYYSNLGVPYSSPAPIVNGTTDKNVIFAPHAYDFMVDTPSYKYANNERIKAIFDEHKRSQERLNVPVIVGEWGGFTDGNEWFHHIKFLLELFDRNHWSQTYWSYFRGITESELFKDVLIRPYPVAVTGKIIEYSYNRESNSFSLEYAQDKEFDEPTQIFLHKKISAVEADGEYEIKNSILNLRTKPGNHKIKIVFEQE